MGGIRSGLDADVGLLEASGEVDCELDGLSLFFGVTVRSAEVVAAWIGARLEVQSEVEHEVALNADSETVCVGVDATVLDPSAVLDDFKCEIKVLSMDEGTYAFGS